MWTIELHSFAHYLDDAAASDRVHFTASNRVEAEMLAAGALVERGLTATEAARFSSRASRRPVHTLRGGDPDRLPRELQLRIYRRFWQLPSCRRTTRLVR